jgi:hypothetical protein
MMAEEDSAQHLVNMKNTWGDIKQHIGGIIDYNFGPWLGKLDTAFGGIKDNLTGIISYVGAVIRNLPAAFKLAMRTVWELFKRTFEWDSLKLIVTTSVQNIGIVISAMLKAVFESIPRMLSALLGGIVQWIAYIAANIESAFLGALQNAINKAGDKIQGTWVGKLFGLGDKLATLDLGAEDKKGEAALYKQRADGSFESLGAMFKDAIGDAIATATTVSANSANMVNTIYGDIGKDFKTALDEIVAPDLVAIAQKADAADQSALLTQIASSGERSASSLAETAKHTEEIDTRLGAQVTSMLSDGLNGMLTGLFGNVTGALWAW